VPFFLEPDYVDKDVSFTESHETRMVRKFGSVAAFDRVKASHGLIPRGAAVGLDGSINFTQDQLDKRVQSSTLNSHRLVLYAAQTFGEEKAEVLYDLLNEFHFLEAGVLNDPVLLEKCITHTRLALTDEEVINTLEFLNDSQRGRSAVMRLYGLTQQQGVNSIPTLVVDGQYAISGTAAAREIVDTIRAAVRDHTGGRVFALLPGELD